MTKFRGHAVPQRDYTYEIDGQTGTITTDDFGNWNFDTDVDVAPGVHRLTLTDVDNPARTISLTVTVNNDTREIIVIRDSGYWGSFDGETDLPNAPGNILDGDRYEDLFPGHTAYDESSSRIFVCTNRGTSGGGDATWSVVSSAGGGGVSDHGLLTGLSDDDHPQYLLVDGSRPADLLEVAGRITAGDLTVEHFSGHQIRTFHDAANALTQIFGFETPAQGRYNISAGYSSSEGGKAEILIRIDDQDSGADHKIQIRRDGGIVISSTAVTEMGGDIKLADYTDVRDDGPTTKALYVDSSGQLQYGDVTGVPLGGTWYYDAGGTYTHYINFNEDEKFFYLGEFDLVSGMNSSVFTGFRQSTGLYESEISASGAAGENFVVVDENRVLLRSASNLVEINADKIRITKPQTDFTPTSRALCLDANNDLIERDISIDVDHGDLVGLGDDDHTQYLRVDGTRAADSLTVTNAATLNGDVTLGNPTIEVTDASTALCLDGTGKIVQRNIPAGGSSEKRLQYGVRWWLDVGEWCSYDRHDGPQSPDWNENLGTGALPIDTQYYYTSPHVPPGATLKRVEILGRFTALFPDFDFIFSTTEVDYGSDISVLNSTDSPEVIIANQNIVASGVNFDSRHMHLYTVDLGNHVTSEHARLRMYVRVNGTTGTEYFNGTLTVVYE